MNELEIKPATEIMLERLLRPLIAYLMRQGWGYIALRDLLKRVYVDEALRGQGGAERLTDSEISVITGINRREVRRLREVAAEPETADPQDRMAGVNAMARVVGTWASSPVFRTEDGAPRILPLRPDPAQVSFEDLLRVAKVDARARAVLEALEKANVVERLPDGQVKLLRAAFTPSLPRDKMLFLTANIGDHLRSAFHNLEGEEPVFIERALFHNRMPAGPLDAARPVLSEMADRLLRQCNEVLLEANAATADTGDADKQATRARRLRLGVYYYETDADDLP
jgi:hypothetical protein